MRLLCWLLPHSWETVAVNRWGVSTGEVCRRCGKSRSWFGGMNGNWKEE